MGITGGCFDTPQRTLQETFRDLNMIEKPGLKRSLSLPLLVFYGLGVIIGAGIYVVISDVAAATGSLAILSFVVAGVFAGLTGLCYAELGARFPEAAGAAAYVKEAFASDRLSRLTGFAVAAVTLVSAATIAHGAASYIRHFIPLSPAVLAVAVVVLFTAVACLGVKDSVRAAAAMTMIEITGLALVVALGADQIQNLPDRIPQFIPHGLPDLGRIFAGAFLAFFAFTGFESLVNMAEEAEDAAKAIPRAILLSLGISTVIYIIVAFVAVAGPFTAGSSDSLLLSVIAHHDPRLVSVFTALAIIAVANGVLIQILMLARLFYGMSRRRLLWGWLSRVNGRQVPLPATLLSGVLIIVSTYALSFESLLQATTTLTLCVFTAVSLSLWRLKTATAVQPKFQVPLWVPAWAAVGNVALIAAQAFLG